MTNEILYAYALLFEVTQTGLIELISEPVKMLLKECLEAALVVNADQSHDILMACTPFAEAPTLAH